MGVGLDEEEEGVAGGDEDLGVIAGGFELVGASEESGFELVGALDGGAEDAGTEGVEFAGGGVHDDEAVGGEDFGEETSEGAGEGGVGGVTLAQKVGDGCPAEELAGAVELGFEMDAACVVAAADAHRAYG